MHEFEGFDDLSKMLDTYAKAASEERVMDALEAGAKEFVTILSKLTKPFSRINSPGYTHLVKTFSYHRNKGQIEVGWGKYYGPILEKGSVKMKKAQPHVKPTWEHNKEHVYKKILDKVWKG